jgi:hypothetical protein
MPAYRQRLEVVHNRREVIVVEVKDLGEEKRICSKLEARLGLEQVRTALCVEIQINARLYAVSYTIY